LGIKEVAAALIEVIRMEETVVNESLVLSIECEVLETDVFAVCDDEFGFLSSSIDPDAVGAVELSGWSLR
jgi:hypothetical protein